VFNILRRLISVVLLFLFLGCSQNVVNFSADSSLSKKLLAQKEQSDKEVEKLEKEIAKLEADKIKYKKEYENFDNNPILDELDETLATDENIEQNTTEETE
jgi:cell division protein FtsB